MDLINLKHLVAAVVYSLLGVVIFVGVFALVDLISPKQLWEEITEKQNVAMAILAGFAALGICIIIAAALIG